MEFRMRINCNTPAFGKKPELHLADILHGIANTVEYIGTEIDTFPVIKTPIHDVNGIKCGVWILDDDNHDHRPENGGRPRKIDADGD